MIIKTPIICNSKMDAAIEQLRLSSGCDQKAEIMQQAVALFVVASGFRDEDGAITIMKDGQAHKVIVSRRKG